MRLVNAQIVTVSHKARTSWGVCIIGTPVFSVTERQKCRKFYYQIMNLLRTVSPEVVSRNTKHGSCFSVICVVINYNIRVKFHGICLWAGVSGSEIHSCNYIGDLLSVLRR